MTDLSVDLGFCVLKNPVIAASGTFGYGPEFQQFLDLNRLGGFVVKGLYYDPRPGNPPPRLKETAAGLINAIGLQGIGVERFAEEILPGLQGLDTAVITQPREVAPEVASHAAAERKRDMVGRGRLYKSLGMAADATVVADEKEA